MTIRKSNALLGRCIFHLGRHKAPTYCDYADRTDTMAFLRTRLELSGFIYDYLFLNL